MTVELLHDRMPIDLLKQKHPDILGFFASYFPKAVADNDTLHFCGVACLGDSSPVVFLPRGFGADISPRAARLTMRALARFGEEVGRLGLSSETGGEASLAATIHNIVADYKRYGLFEQRLRVRSRNSGKPNWKLTIQRQLPLLSRSRRPVFATVESSRSLSVAHNLLAVIQAATLREITKRHGWWCDLDQSSLADLSRVPPPQISNVRFASAIRAFKRFLFDDRSLALADLLIQYWLASSLNSDGWFICGVSDFSAVWENMLKCTVHDVSDQWNSKLPTPGYFYAGGDFVPRTKGGVIDIIVENAEGIIVADAKYYGAHSTATAPGFSDILKQSFYAKSVSDISKGKTVTSFFVFPTWGSSQRLKIGGFRVRGTHEEVPWLDDVGCLYVSVYPLMESYVRRSPHFWYRDEESGGKVTN
jgi:hypothetical protein